MFSIKLIDTSTWRPAFERQSVLRVSRGFAKPKIVRVKKCGILPYYTMHNLAEPIPRKYRHATRRAAKRAFSRPMLVGSAKQLASAFGPESPAFVNAMVYATDKPYVKRITDDAASP